MLDRLRISTRLQALIWRDGFPGPICARAYVMAPYCDRSRRFVQMMDAIWVVGVLWPARGLGVLLLGWWWHGDGQHCQQMFDEAMNDGD